MKEDELAVVFASVSAPSVPIAAAPADLAGYAVEQSDIIVNRGTGV